MARVHAEGVLDAFRETIVSVQHAHADTVLARVHLPDGAVTFARPAVRFAQMPVFRALGLGDAPALILGMDQLSRMGAIAIDFPRAELQLRP